MHQNQNLAQTAQNVAACFAPDDGGMGEAHEEELLEQWDKARQGEPISIVG